MKKMYKVMALVLCAVLLVAGSVMGTLAYLQMKTDPITNTMTVGNVSITLDEAKVDAYGVKDGDTRIIAAPGQAGNKYKLIPGHTYVKDPTITVKADSEACYLFVKVENGIVDIEAEGTTTIAEQMKAKGWSELGVENVWFKKIETMTTEDTKHPVFESFVVKNDANVDAYANATITITAYAIQADGFTDGNSNGTAADEAWAASGFGS